MQGIELSRLLSLDIHRSHLSRGIGHDFVAVEKPLALKIRVAIDAYEAAAERRTKHFDNRADMADQLGDGALTLANADPIAVFELAIRRWRHYLAHYLTLSFYLALLGSP